MEKSEPKISVFNRQRRIPVDTGKFQRFLQRLARRVGLDGGLSVVLVSDPAMRRYQLEFRGKNQATDVLSFPYEREEWERAEPYLGDVIVSVETADRQRKGALMDELKVLSMHGILHLLGHDHETDQGEMRKIEARLKKEYRLR